MTPEQLSVTFHSTPHPLLLVPLSLLTVFAGTPMALWSVRLSIEQCAKIKRAWKRL
jgi:hypothetical protein